MKQASPGTFRCNVCGATSKGPEGSNQERADCHACHSSMRIRGIVLVLSRTLFGADLALPDFPVLKSVCGLGISDSDIYADRLSRAFTYTNSFYHREPFLDLMHPDPGEFGRYDFVICSDVLEHIPPPAEQAFTNLAKLLKPAGTLILTLPYSLEEATIEHYPALGEFGIVEVGGKPVLIHRDGGSYKVYDGLVFHNGPGQTLEMRVYSESDIRNRLQAAGLGHIRITGIVSSEFGISVAGPCSLPIVASRQPFTLGGSGVAELVEQWTAQRRVLEMVKQSRWVRLGRRLALGPNIGIHA